ncbi:outer membrane beta-barrel protein, partial [Salinivirga cyanobacteriivorans]
MKKSILLIITMVAFIGVNAQINIGGSVGFSVSNSESTTDGTSVDGPSNTNIRLLPEVEYMLAENLSIGGQIGFSFNKTNDDANDYESSLFMFEIAPYGRMYFPLGENIELFGEGGIGFARGTEKITVGSTTNDGNTYTDFSLGVAPGLRYAISEKLKLELRAGYLGYMFSSVNDNGDP